MTQPSTTPAPDPLAAKKAAIAQQQAADNAAVTESETALHQLADKIHNAAFARGQTPSFADSLRAAAGELIEQAGKVADFPAAALVNLQRYAPTAPPATPAHADPIAAAEAAAEAAAA